MFCNAENVEMVGSRTTQHTLWVDKYAPRHYTHLLSDDVSVSIIYIRYTYSMVYMEFTCIHGGQVSSLTLWLPIKYYNYCKRNIIV